MFELPGAEEIKQALEVVRTAIPETPAYNWPRLSEACGAEVIVKHENHTPLGAFKARSGLVLLDHLKQTDGLANGVVTATRGNHGQAVSFAGKRLGVSVKIVVPEGNNADQNAAIKAHGADLIVHGHDFQASVEHAHELAAEEGRLFLPSFHPMLVRGTATYAWELLSLHPDLDTVYVPIGLGSGIAGVIAARNALGLSTKIVGVVSEGAPAYALSFREGKAISTNAVDTMADGIAIRCPNPDAVDIICKWADRVIMVPEQTIRDAIRHYFDYTHNVAEGAGAASLAGLLSEAEGMRGKKVGVILSGQNLDRPRLLQILSR